MPTRAPQTRARTIDVDAISRRGVSLPESWLRGILAGAEGVLGTWLIVVVPAIAVYIATASAPELGSASWVEAAQLGTGAWLAGHGAHLQVGEITLTLLPLGITLMALGLTVAAVRRAALETWAGPAFAVGTYVAGAALLAKVVDTPGTGRAVAGALVVSALAAGIGMRKTNPGLPAPLKRRTDAIGRSARQWVQTHPRGSRIQALAEHTGAAVRAGTGAAVRTLAGIGVAGFIAVIIAASLGMALMRAVHERLDADIVSSAVLTGAQVLMLPTVIVWAASYLSGAGFTMGDGTLYSPGEVISGPLPALPMLGALPNPESALVPALGYVLLAVGAVGGWYLHRRLVRHYNGEAPPGAVAGAVVVAVAVVAAAVFLLAGATTGGFGPGRFAADVGPLRGAFVRSALWQIGAPMLAVCLALHPAFHRLLGAGREKLRSLASRDAAE